MGNCGGWELPVDSRPLGRVTHCSWCVFPFCTSRRVESEKYGGSSAGRTPPASLFLISGFGSAQLCCKCWGVFVSSTAPTKGLIRLTTPTSWLLPRAAACTYLQVRDPFEVSHVCSSKDVCLFTTSFIKESWRAHKPSIWQLANLKRLWPRSKVHAGHKKLLQRVAVQSRRSYRDNPNFPFPCFVHLLTCLIINVSHS